MQLLRQILFSLLFLSTLYFAQEYHSPSDTSSFVVSDIKIIGNKETKAYVILNELTFKVGDKINWKILSYNRDRIYGLKIFNFVDIVTDNRKDKKRIIIVVKETWTIFPIPYFYFRRNSIKYSAYGINFLYKNFRGRNETLSANLGFGFDPNFFIQYNNPNFFYRNLIFGFTIGYTNFFNKSVNFLTISKEDFNYKSFYTGFNLGKRVNIFHQFEFGFLYRYITLKKPYAYQYLSSGRNFEYEPSLSFSYRYDTRDLVLRSRKGTYLQFSLTHYGFYLSGIHFVDFSFDYRKYFPINKMLFFKYRITNRYLIGDKIPIYDRSYIGYNNYIRGHLHDVKEGKNMFIASFELGVPLVEEYDFVMKLPLLPESLTSARIGLDLNTFVDIGNTYDSLSELSLKRRNLFGYGVSLNLLILPFNALRFEIAFNEFGNSEFIFESGFSF